MIEEEPEIDVVEGWVTETCRFSGNFKLIAEFEHEESGAQVRVTPYKTYSQPGFCNAHRVIFVHPEDGVEEVAVGMEVEHVEDAEEAAVTKMEEFSQSQDRGNQSLPTEEVVPEGGELPDNWHPTIAELVEHNTLCAVYELEDSETVVRIEPLPTDRLADYTQTHRVVIETSDRDREIVAEGTEVDDVIDAKLAAVKAMKRV